MRVALLALAFAAATAACSDDVDSPSVTNPSDTDVLTPAGTGDGLDRGAIDEPLDDDITGD